VTRIVTAAKDVITFPRRLTRSYCFWTERQAGRGEQTGQKYYLHGAPQPDGSEALMSYFGNRLTLGYTDLLYVDIMNLDYG
jgi:hypothetical protein